MATINVQVQGGQIKQIEAYSIADIRTSLAVASNYQASANGEPVSASEESDALDAYAFVSFAPKVKGA